MAENTARRGVYLPKELDDWFLEMAKETDIKPNALFVEALLQYRDGRTKTFKENNSKFEKKVIDIIQKYEASNIVS